MHCFFYGADNNMQIKKNKTVLNSQPERKEVLSQFSQYKIVTVMNFELTTYWQWYLCTIKILYANREIY